MADSTTEITKKIEHYIRLILRQRWLIIIPLLISLPVGLYLTLTLPRIYEARTLILVEPQRVPAKYVESIVNTNIEEQVSTLRQQILSRTNLEQIINQFNLFSNEEYKNVFLEDKLESLRKRINIDVTSAGRGANAFSINFKGRDPTTVKDVTNALAASFIDINLRMREDRAMGTSAFLDSQLEDMRKRLIEVEEALKEYRKNNMGELPEQMDANLKMLDRLQSTMTERQEALRESKLQLAQFESVSNEKMLLLDRELEQTRRMSNSLANQLMSDDFFIPDEEIIGTTDSNLEELQQQYSSLLTRYTDKHPDVRRLKKVIDEIENEEETDAKKDLQEEKIEEPIQKSINAHSADSTTIQEEQEGQEEQLFEFSMPSMTAMIEENIERERSKINEKRKLILSEFQRIEEDIAGIKKDIQEYQSRVDATPKREQDLLSLQRDYRNIQQIYSSLLDRRLEAEIAVSMERRSKGEQFRILDPAAIPQKPISPDVKKLLLLSLIAGIAVGGGLIFLLEFLNTSIRYSEEVEKEIGIPVLAAIPKIPKPHERVTFYVNLFMSIISFAMIFVLFSGFAVLALKGVDPTLTAVRKIDFMNRFLNL